MAREDQNTPGFIEAQLAYVKPLWPIDAALFSIALIGLATNIILLLVVCRRKKAWAVDTMLISVVAFFDILWCSTFLINLVSRWILGEKVLMRESIWCQFSAISFSSLFMSCIVCTAILALARYVAIVRRAQISNRLWMGVSILLVGILWVFFIIQGLTVKLTVMPAGVYCLPEVVGTNWVTKLFEFYMHGLLCCSIVLIPTLYTLITIYYRRQLIKLHSSENQRLLSKLHRDTFQLIAVLLAYSLAMFPDIIHIILCIATNIRRTPLSDGIVIGLEFCMSSINALFALLMHDEIRSEFQSLIGISVQNSYLSNVS